MSKIQIKIVEVSQESNTVLVKYASENSNKPIDEYPPVAFQVNKFPVKSLDEFIEAIRPLVTMYVTNRDLEESPIGDVDISTWEGHTATVESTDVVDPYKPEQMFPGLSDPEVIL